MFKTILGVPNDENVIWKLVPAITGDECVG